MNIREKCIEAMWNAGDPRQNGMDSVLDAVLSVLADPENWTKVKGRNEIILSWDKPPVGFDDFAAVINHVRGME